MSVTKIRHRNPIRHLAAAAALAAATGALVATQPAAPAEATPGRRICQYTYAAGAETAQTRNFYIVTRIKTSTRDNCWSLNRDVINARLRNDSAFKDQAWAKQEITSDAWIPTKKKVRCEDFGRIVRANFDPCSPMPKDDVIYLVEKPRDGAYGIYDPEGNLEQKDFGAWFHPIGHAKDFKG